MAGDEVLQSDVGMSMFLWQRLDNLTGHWHEEGAVLVIAETISRAKWLLVQASSKSRQDYGYADRKSPFWTEENIPEPTLKVRLHASYVAGGDGERVYIFEDSGCC